MSRGDDGSLTYTLKSQKRGVFAVKFTIFMLGNQAIKTQSL